MWHRPASLQTASPAPVPLARVTKLVFATCFINLAVPSTAARVATSIRFFQRSGTTAAGAVSAGALDSVFGFVAQITLLVGFLLLGLGTLGVGRRIVLRRHSCRRRRTSW